MSERIDPKYADDAWRDLGDLDGVPPYVVPPTKGGAA